MDTHGKKYSILCKSDGTFATPTWPTCREPANCTGDIPAPPQSSLLQNSTSNLVALMEFDDAIFKCKDSSHVVGTFEKIKNFWNQSNQNLAQPLGNHINVHLINFSGDTSEDEFKLQCNKDLGADGIGFETPDPWPTCKEPPVTTTIDPNAPTTPKPLPPCQCIGDIPVDQAKIILDKFCRNYTIEGNMPIQPNKEEGTTPPSMRRCGSRNPEEPTLADHCYCSGVDKQASMCTLWMKFHLRNNYVSFC